MRGTYALAAALATLAVLGCGDDSGSSKESGGGLPSREVLEEGPVGSFGCLACHRIGSSGHDGPGPDLSDVGARLPRAQIEKALEKGPGIMPSFSALSPAETRNLVDFLYNLRGDR